MSVSFPVYHLGKLIMVSAQSALSLFGYHVNLVSETNIYHYGVFDFQVGKEVKIFLGFSCLGLGVMWVFTSLIISWTGRTLAKTVYILSGLIIIFCLNVSRKTNLTWISRDGTNFDSKTFSIFGNGNYTHHDLFNFFIYIVIFLLFILWVEVFAKKYPK